MLLVDGLPVVDTIGSANHAKRGRRFGHGHVRSWSTRGSYAIGFWGHDYREGIAMASETSHDRLIGTVMVGYEGHRGWINYLVVHPDHRGRGLGRALVHEAEQRLGALGCPKSNLQVRSSNRSAIDFYRRIGYSVDDVVSLGRRLRGRYARNSIRMPRPAQMSMAAAVTRVAPKTEGSGTRC